MQIPWPFTNAPGDEAQEGAGKLTNVFVERRGDEESVVWRRSPGCKVFVVDPSVASIVGSAAVTGVSSVVNAIASLVGSAAVSGSAQAIGLIKTQAELIGGAEVTGATAVQIGASAEIVGGAELDAIPPA